MQSDNFKNLFKTAFFVASLCGLSYFAAILLLHSIGLSMSGWIEWVFRISVIITVTWSIMGFRIKYAPKGIGFGKAFGLGMLSSLILGIYMSMAIYLFQNSIAPDYNEKFQLYYKKKRSDQMYNTQLKKQISIFDVSYKLTAQDTIIVEKGLNLHIEKSKFFFTANGAAIINFVFSLLWGIAVSVSIAIMARKK